MKSIQRPPGPYNPPRKTARKSVSAAAPPLHLPPSSLLPIGSASMPASISTSTPTSVATVVPAAATKQKQNQQKHQKHRKQTQLSITKPHVDIVRVYETPTTIAKDALALLRAYKARANPARLAAKCAPRALAAIKAKSPVRSQMRSQMKSPKHATVDKTANRESGESGEREKGSKGDCKPLVCVFDIDDTLIFDKGKNGIPNAALIDLLHVLVREGVQVVLVTARSRSADNERWTRDQLTRMSISGFSDLQLAPDKDRKSMAAVSAWKLRMRKAAARNAGALVVLSVGDAWSDLVQLRDDDDFDMLDDQLALRAVQEGLSPNKTHWAIVRPNDGLSCWGIKLKSEPFDS